MSKKAHHPHLGKLIAHRLEEIGMTKAEFARRISCSRQNVSILLGKESFDTKQLMRMGEVLGTDFFQALSAVHGVHAGGGRVVEMQLSFANQRLLLVTTESDVSVLPTDIDQRDAEY
jgi:transcriptional regulator with XRE-family HTH domain